MSQTEEQTPAVEQVKEKAGEAKDQASSRVREQLDSRSTQVGEQATSIATAVRRASEQLRQEGQQGPARLLEQGADRVEQAGSWLREKDGDTMLRDVEDFGRRRPWVIAAGAAVAGFAASRFLGASSRRRYERFDGAPTYRRVPSPTVAPYEDTGTDAW